MTAIHYFTNYFNISSGFSKKNKKKVSDAKEIIYLQPAKEDDDDDDFSPVSSIRKAIRIFNEHLPPLHHLSLASTVQYGGPETQSHRLLTQHLLTVPV